MHFETPLRFRKGRLISIQKIKQNTKNHELFCYKQIFRLVNWWCDVTNKIKEVNKQNLVAEISCSYELG